MHSYLLVPSLQSRNRRMATSLSEWLLQKEHLKGGTEASNAVFERQLSQLFCPNERELFQLDYLYHSPLFSQSSPFRELVQVLERFNEQTQQMSQNSFSFAAQTQSRVRLAAVKLLYREMMCLARKEQTDIKESDHPAKLRDWYYGLEHMPNFFQSLHIKKKTPPSHYEPDALIRSKYSSNVFEEIDDYVRRRVELPKPEAEAPLARPRFPKSNTSSTCNLPLIDHLLYQRAHKRMRQYRESSEEKQFLQTVDWNKSKNRQSLLSKLNYRSNMKEQKKKGSFKLGSLFHTDIGFRTKTSGPKIKGSQHLSLHSKNNDLGIISGINLMCNHLQ